MNEENQMRDDLLQQNGIKPKSVTPKQMKTYKDGFWLLRLSRFSLTILAIILWLAASITYITFACNAFLLALKYSQLTEEDGYQFNNTVMPMIVSCFSVPFIIAAAGILTYYIYSLSKNHVMLDVQQRLRAIEEQLAEQSNQ